MSTEKDRQVFQESLKGMKPALDRFGTPMVEGEIIAYAVAHNSSAQLKVGKIIKVKREEIRSSRSVKMPDGTWSYVPYTDQKVTLSIRGAEKWSNDQWKLQAKPSNYQNIHNAIVLVNPKQEILDLFKEKAADETAPETDEAAD